jgi:hypothetical protein
MTTIGCLSPRGTVLLIRVVHMHLDSLHYQLDMFTAKPPLIKLHACRWCLDLLRSGLLPARVTLATSEQHTAHHIHQGVPLSWDLDSEVLLANLRQSIIPDTKFPNLCRVVCSKLTEEIGASALDSQQQQTDEIYQRKRREYTGIRAGTADFLHAKLGVGGRELRDENEQGFVRAAEISSEEVWENCARRIDRCGVRFVTGVPLIFEFRQRLRRFGGS